MPSTDVSSSASPEVGTVDMKLEVVTLPVSDVDRAKAFYQRLGWRTEFSWEVFARWTERRGDMRLIERRPVPPFGHFSLLRFVKSPEVANAEPLIAEAG